jgi:hypothetical protein
MAIVGFPLDGGGQVLVRVDGDTSDWSGVVTRGGGMEERLQEAQCTFEAALDPIRTVAQGVLDRLSALERAPDEVRVEFGLELSAKAGAIVSASGSAALNVALTWRNAPAGSAAVKATGP